jgi:predicted ribosome quality control (RQC) complex YloA/Tae2 family protein
MSLMKEDPQPSSEPDAEIWRGRSVARRFLSPDGWVVLVGRTAEDNDILTFKIGAPHDFWLHVSGESGAHVIVRNPDHLDRLPRETLRFAAALAARHSRARKAGTVTVHVTTCAEVSKPRGVAAGKVTLRRFRSIRSRPD